MNGNQLKLLALATMTVDHIGYILFPDVQWLRAVGRLAFPIFAFMVAEGCFYTHDRRRYLATMCAFAAGIQLAYWLFLHSLYQSIMTTFALSLATVFSLQRLDGRRDAASACLAAGMLAFDVFSCVTLPGVLGWGYGIDYGFFGVMLPVFAYLPHFFCDADGKVKATAGGSLADGAGETNAAVGDGRAGGIGGVKTVVAAGNGRSGEIGEMDAVPAPKAISPRLRRMMLASFAAGLLALCIALDRPAWHVQWFSLLALVPLALYDGTRGRARMKYLFYVYYPAHLAVLYGIGVACGLR